MDASDTDLEWLHPTLDRCRQLIARVDDIQRWTKLDSDGRREPVTEIDLAVDALLAEAIHGRIPDATILSEESNPDPAAFDADTVVVVDPIDGTDELAAGRPGYAVAVALFHQRRPLASVLDMPAYDRRLTCRTGRGTFLNGRAVELSALSDLSAANLAVSGTQYLRPDLKDFWASLPAAHLTPTPAFAAKVAAVLAGDVDAAVYLAVDPLTAAVWDYAAPAQLLEEAGGLLTDQHGTPLLDRAPTPHADGWIAAPARLNKALIDFLASNPGVTDR